MMREIYRRDEVELTWASVETTSTMIAPETDTEIDVRNAKNIVFQIDCLATTYAGDNTDINVITRTETATTYDNVPYAEANIGSASVKSVPVTPGMAYMKVRVDNNSTSAKCKPKVIVQVTG